MVDPIDSTIIAMWAGGATAGQIAKTIGYGRNVVTGKINSLIQAGGITSSHKQSRMNAINIRIGELERVREETNFAEEALSGFRPMRLTLVQLSHNSCRFIVENVRRPTYCGHEKFKQSYCEHHYKLCYMPKPVKATDQ
jgi:hypothetical protein